MKQRIWWVDLAAGPDSAESIEYNISIGYMSLKSASSIQSKGYMDFTDTLLGRVTAELDGPTGEFIFAGKHGIGIGQRYSPQWKYIRRFWTESEAELESRMRANDGAVDSEGRFWVGIVNDPLVAKPAPVGMFVPRQSLKIYRSCRSQGCLSGWTQMAVFIG